MGTWFHSDDNGKTYTASEVSFSRDFRGRYLNDRICQELCKDKIVVINNLKGKRGDLYSVRIKLYRMKNKLDEKYVSVEKCGYVDNIPYEIKATELAVVTVKACAEIMMDVINDIFFEMLENDGFNEAVYIDKFKENLKGKILDISAMREYPEAVSIESAMELLTEIIENTDNGIYPDDCQVFSKLREISIDWFKVDFEDDGAACANGYSLSKPQRDDMSNVNMKPKYRGEWDGLPVVFTRTYKNFYADDTDCEKLCNGETVEIGGVKFKLVKKKISGIFRICMSPV